MTNRHAPVTGKAQLLAAVRRRLEQLVPDAAGDTHAFFVPGRIEFLGKHTDYAGGRSLLCAIERGIALAARARSDQLVRIFDLSHEQQIEFAFRPDLIVDATSWANYPMTVARRLARNFPGPCRGADLTLASDLPTAAGLSSSSALVIAIYFALAKVNRLEQHPAHRAAIHTREDLAGYLATVENGRGFADLAGDRGVGTLGGSQDHTAILCSQSGHMRQYSFLPTRLERTITLPRGYAFVIANSGVRAEKTGPALSLYNHASQLAAAVLAQWQAATGRGETSLGAVCAAGGANQLREILQRSPGAYPPQHLLNRFDHFALESEQIIPAAGDALADARFDLLGELVDRSVAGAIGLLGNQIPETIFLAQSARRLGAVAASPFGAGFGGSVWALLPEQEADSFSTQWAAEYAQAFPSPAGDFQAITTTAGPPAVEA